MRKPAILGTIDYLRLGAEAQVFIAGTNLALLIVHVAFGVAIWWPWFAAVLVSMFAFGWANWRIAVRAERDVLGDILEDASR